MNAVVRLNRTITDRCSVRTVNGIFYGIGALAYAAAFTAVVSSASALGDDLTPDVALTSQAPTVPSDPRTPGPIAPIFDDLTGAWDPLATPLDDGKNPGEASRAERTTTASTPRTTTAPARTTPPPPTDGTFGDGCEEPGTLPRCQPDYTPPATTPTTTAPASSSPAPADSLPELVNRDRLAAGCPPIAIHPDLQAHAQGHADTQAADDRMHHSDGPPGFDTWGENVAWGQDTAAHVHEAWMSSDSHRDNILDCSFRWIGVGATDSADGIRYWTEVFGT